MSASGLKIGSLAMCITEHSVPAVQMKIRSAQQCRERYELLLAGLRDSRSTSLAPVLPASSSLAAPGPVSSAPSGASLAGQVPAGTSSAAAASSSHATGVPPLAGGPAHSQVVSSAAGRQPDAGLPGSAPSLAAPSAGVSVTAPLHAAGKAVWPAGQQSVPGPTPQHIAAPAHASSAPAKDTAQGLAGLGSIEKQDIQPGGPNAAIWSLSAELQTLREHLAWLANSNVVCSTEVSRS